MGLTTGWEPEVPVEDSLVRQYLAAVAERMESSAAAGGRRAERHDDLVLVDQGSPGLFDNAAILLQPPPLVDPPEVMGRVLDFFGDDRSFALYSAALLGDLSSFGVELMGHPPLMARAPGPAEVPDTGDVEIREVATADDLATFERVAAAHYPMPSLQGAPPGTSFPAGMLGGDTRFWLAWHGGDAVGTAMAHVAHGATSVEFVSVDPAVRGRRLGEALTWQATLADPSLPAVLVASDLGQPLYERMGYLRVLRMTLWFRGSW